MAADVTGVSASSAAAGGTALVGWTVSVYGIGSSGSGSTSSPAASSTCTASTMAISGALARNGRPFASQIASRARLRDSLLIDFLPPSCIPR